jgi:large subunit ribosomal protein L6
MSVSVADNFLIIKNFLGEKIPRKVKLKPGVTVKVEGNIVVVEGADKEITGQVAADIEQTTRRPGFDKRIFQDGIYIIDKSGKKI